jgi:general transcription factor IIIA
LNKHVANHSSAAGTESNTGVDNEHALTDTDTGVDKGRLTGDGSALKRFGCPIHAAEGLLARPKDTPDQPGVTSSPDTIIVDCSGAAPNTESMPGQIDEYDPSGRPTAETLQAWDESLLTCPMRFWRVYDVRRHLAAEHGLVLEDAEVRKLLGMAV